MGGLSLKDLLANSKEQTPDSLARMNEYADKAWKEIDNPMAHTVGFKLPWKKCGDSLVLRKGEVTIVAGVNGHGKTVAVGQVSVGVMMQGGKVCVASMESRPHKWAVKMFRQYCSMSRLRIPENRQEFDNIWQWFDENLIAYGSPGRGICKDILEVFRYSRRRYGANFFLVDNLSALDVPLDDYEGQRNFIQKLVEFAKSEEVHVLLVAHQRKPEDDSKAGDRFKIKGSGSLSDLSDNVLIWWRNRKKEKKVREGALVDIKEPDALLICDKQRETGVEPSFKLWFEFQSGTFLEEPKAQRPANTEASEWDQVVRA